MANVGKPWRNVQVFFWLHSGQKCEPTVQILAISASYLRPKKSNWDTLKLKSSTWYGQCREVMEKCSSLFLTAQWAKMWANHPNFSHFSLISQAREVELRHFKSLKPSTWYLQCRKAMKKCSRLFLTAQWAKMGAYRCIFSHFSLISQARKVELRHFKSLIPCTWYEQCGDTMKKCSSLFLTAQWAKMWANRPNFSHFSLISQAREVELRHFKSLKPNLIWAM